MTIEQQAQQLSLDTDQGLVELFVLDCAVIGGTVYRFTPNTASIQGGSVMWQGYSYLPMPLECTGFEYKGDGSQAKPSLRVSNVNKVLLQAVVSLGDIVGAKLTRYRTFANFLDNGSTPDPSAYFPPDVFIVEQKLSHNNTEIIWQLCSIIDRMGLKLPRRQIIKDGDSRYGKFPAVGAYRPTGF